MSKGGEKMGDAVTMNKSFNGKNMTECHKMDKSEIKIDDGNADDVRSSESDNSDLKMKIWRKLRIILMRKQKLLLVQLQHVCNLKIWMI